MALNASIYAKTTFCVQFKMTANCQKQIHIISYYQNKEYEFISGINVKECFLLIFSILSLL